MQLWGATKSFPWQFENISAKHRKYLPQDVKPGFIGLLQPQCCFTLSSHSWIKQACCHFNDRIIRIVCVGVKLITKVSIFQKLNLIVILVMIYDIELKNKIELCKMVFFNRSSYRMSVNVSICWLLSFVLFWFRFLDWISLSASITSKFYIEDVEVVWSGYVIQSAINTT